MPDSFGGVVGPPPAGERPWHEPVPGFPEYFIPLSVNRLRNREILRDLNRRLNSDPEEV